MRKAQRLGWYAAFIQFVFAVVLGGFASLNGEPEPGVLSRGMVILWVFTLPAVVGWIGVRSQRPALVGAAALTSGVGAFIAFSGVTLIFLVPAALFLASAAFLVVPEREAPGGSPVSGGRQVLLATAIGALVLAAGACGLLMTDSACWITYQTATGSLIETFPFSNEMTLGPDATRGGCSNGLISLRGVGLGALFTGAAIVMAALAARRPAAPVLEPPAPAPAG